MSSQLDAIKARSEAATEANSSQTMNYNAVYSVVWRSQQDVPTLVAALEAVLELHKEVQWKESWPTCIHCNSGEGSPLAYPCPTVTAIQSALGEVEK